MPVYLGDKEIEIGAFGDKELVNLYLGDKEIWGGGKVIDLGWGTSWDIKSLYPKLYNKLTADNFLLVAANTVSYWASMKPSGTYQEYTNCFDGIIKSYNASTGVLEFRTQGDGDTSGIRTNSVRVVLVVKLDKLTYLGYGTTFNVANVFPNDYKNMTVNNFALRTIVHWNTSGTATYSLCSRSGRVGDGYTTYSDDGQFGIVKSYDANTGVLRMYGRSWGTSDPNDSWDRSCNAYVYASKKPLIV